MTAQAPSKGVGLLAAMGPVQSQAKLKSWLTKVPVGAETIKSGPKWIENRRFGPKQRPNESYGLCGPIRTTPEAKNYQKNMFLRHSSPFYKFTHRLWAG